MSLSLNAEVFAIFVDLGIILGFNLLNPQAVMVLQIVLPPSEQIYDLR
ncbi:MAG: hypothetical protein WBV73_19335 [Phormidium sp.]